jgi:hypothetical protein
MFKVRGRARAAGHLDADRAEPPGVRHENPGDTAGRALDRQGSGLGGGEESAQEAATDRGEQRLATHRPGIRPAVRGRTVHHDGVIANARD